MSRHRWEALHGWEALRRDIPGALSLTELNILAIEATDAKGRDALEVGHYKGLSTAAILGALPEGVRLWTIDHHEGDEHCSPTSSTEFEENIRGYADRRLQSRGLVAIFEPFESALESVPDNLGFVFYDADHSIEAVEDFWEIVHPKLSRVCSLLVDDADWPGSLRLMRLAENDGFRVAGWSGATYRGKRDKADPRTNTMGVLIRE